MFSRFIKKAAGWFAGFGLLVFALVLVLSLVLRSEKVKNEAAAYVNGLIPGSITYDSLSLSLFRGAVEAVNVSVRDPEEKPVITAKRVYVNLSWLALIRKTLRLDTVVLDDPDVCLETDLAGNINIVRAFSKYPPTETDGPEGPFELPVDLTFGTLEMNRGVFRYRDIGAPKEPDEEILVKGISLNASRGNINRRSGKFRLELGPCDIHLEDMNSHVKNLTIESALKRDVLSPFALYLDSDMGRCDLKGSISDLWKGPRYDLDVNLDVDLAGIDRVFDVECELVGRVTGGGTVKGHWDDPEIKALLHCDGGKVLGEVVGDLDLDAHMKARVIDIRRLFVKAPGGTGTIRGFVYFDKAFKDGFFTSDFIEPAFAYDLRADQVWTRPFLIPGMPGAMKGRVQSKLNFKGKGFFFESMVATANISATAEDFRFLEGQGPDRYRLTTSAAMDHSRLSVKTLEVEDEKTAATVKGLYNTATDAWNADIAVRSGDLSRSTLLKLYADLAGRLTLESSLEGTWDVVSGRLRSKGEGLAFEGVDLGDADVQGVLNPSGVFTVETATLKHPKASVQASGDIGVLDGKNAMDLFVTFSDLEAGYVLDEDRLKGICEGDLRLQGVVEDPVADLKLMARNLAWDQVSLGDVNTQARYGKGLVTVKDLELVNKRSLVNLKGTALVLDTRSNTFFHDPVCDIAVQGNDLRIEDFYPRLKGTVSLAGQVRGPLTRPYGRLEMEAHALDLVKQTVAGVKGLIRFDGEDVVIQHLSADVKNGETLEASGRVSIVNETYDLALKTKGVSIGHIDALTRQNICEGKITLDLEGRGRFKEPELRGKVTVFDVKVSNESFENADLDVLLEQGDLTVTGKALAGVDAKLNIHTHDFSARVLFENTALEPFFRMGKLVDFGGGITGRVTASGNLDKPDEVKARVDITDLDVKNKDMTLVKNDDLHIAYEKKRFRIQDSRLVLLDKGYLVLGGQGRVDGDLDVYLKGAVPLSVVDLFSDELSGMKGEVLVDGRVGGTLKKPDVLADLDIRAAAFMIPELMQDIHDVNGSVHVDSKSVTIRRLKGKLDSGTFGISGALALDNFKPGYLSLNVSGEALPITVPDMLDLTLNTKITVKGTPDDALIEGSLVILYGKYYKDVSLDLVNVVKVNNRQESTAGPRFTEPYLRSMGLNLSLTHKNPFEVDNNVAYLPLKPNLRVLGTMNSPRLSGRAEVETDDSTISYQGKVFDVTKGRVDFVNPYIIEPTLDVQCETAIRDWTIYLLISGTPENLKFSLTSKPVEEDADILSLLVLGKTTDEIIEGNGDKTQSAAKLLAGILSSNIEKNIKDATGIDTVEVEYITTTNSATGDSENGEQVAGDTVENGVKVTLGKELSERMALKYGVETKGGLTIHQASSEYKFFENMLMKAYQDTDNKYGAELVYRIEFR